MKKEQQIYDALKKGQTLKEIRKSLKVTANSIMEIREKYPDEFAHYSKHGPKKSDNQKIRFSFRVPKKTGEEINKHLESRKLTPTEFFNKLIDKWLEGFTDK
jgi:hypothetical protein